MLCLNFLLEGFMARAILSDICGSGWHSMRIPKYRDNYLGGCRDFGSTPILSGEEV